MLHSHHLPRSLGYYPPALTKHPTLSQEQPAALTEDPSFPTKPLPNSKRLTEPDLQLGGDRIAPSPPTRPGKQLIKNRRNNPPVHDAPPACKAFIEHEIHHHTVSYMPNGQPQPGQVLSTAGEATIKVLQHCYRSTTVPAGGTK